MSYYGLTGRPPARDISAARCISSLEALLAAIDKVYELSIIGGEPFTHKELGTILEAALKQPKLKVISFTTNGTLIPSKDLLEKLRHPRIIVYISDYVNLSTKKAELTEIFEKCGIRYQVFAKEKWRDFGDMSPRHRDYDQLCEVFYQCCASHCVALYDGKLHQCAHSAHGMDLGLIPDAPQDYVDVFGGSTAEVRQKIMDFRLNTKTISACDYCDYSRALPLRVIEAAVQRKGDAS
jgi:MoaA/NifB/PqqE/SkfB family radical SAM enzyme